MADALKKVLAELGGTYIFFLIGFGGIVAFLSYIPKAASPTLTPSALFLIAIAFGVGIFIGIMLVGHISGGHLNPAVTISLFLVGKFEGRLVIPYIIAQLFASVLAAATVGVFFGFGTANLTHFGATVPGSMGPYVALLAEFIMTFFFLWVILTVATRTTEVPVISAVLGVYITAMLLLIGSISGGSVNPARSFGPAAVSGILLQGKFYQWIYWVGPILGGILGSFAFKFMNGDKARIHY